MDDALGQVPNEGIDAPADAAADDEPGPQRRSFVVRRELKRRVDQYLHQRLKGISRSKVQQFIEAGGVSVNGRLPKASTLLHLDDRVDVILPPPALSRIVPENIPLHILHEDDALIVLNKQADLIIHPARGKHTDTLVNALAWHLKQQLEARGGAWRGWRTRGFGAHEDRHGSYQSRRPAQVPGLSSVGGADLRPGIVHRLDKNTTGVMVVAKSDLAHWRLARQFEDRSTLKAYLAIVHGNLPEAGGVIDEPIGKHPTIREAFAVRRDSSARSAVTLFRVREQYRGFALMELELKTGRTHQIRVHLSYLGHPIVGDIVYGGEAIGAGDLADPPVPAGGQRFVTFARDRDEGLRLEARARQRSDLILAHPALHAAFLRFTHPLTQKIVTFTAPVHEPMAGLIRQLRRQHIDAPTAQDGWWIDLNAAIPACAPDESAV